MKGNTNPTPFTGKDGQPTPDYYAIVSGIDASGNVDPLKTDGTGKLLTSVSGAGSGGTSAVDDMPFAAGVDAGTPMMGLVTNDSVDSGDAGVIGMLANRQVKVSLFNSSGVEITSFGGGTEYTDGDSTPANPVGGIPLFDDGGVITAVSDTHPLPVLASIDTTGLATSAKQDTGNSTLSAIDGHVDGIEGLLTTIDADTGNIATSAGSIDTKTPALGQAVAAASVPVVLTAAQILTLTPPAAITGFATSAKQDTGNASLATIAGLDFATQTTLASLLTSSQLIDDVVYTDDTSTHSTGSSKGALIMAAAAPSDTAVNANDIGAVAMTVNRALYTSVVDSLPAGSNAIGKLAANSGVDIGDVDVTSIAAGSNTIGGTYCVPNTSGGLATFNATSSDGATALTNSAQAIKASAGQLFGWYIYNPNVAAAFVQLYNTAAGSVTVGTTGPLFMLTIPAGSGANVFNDVGITFSNAGWSCAATSTAGGNGAPSTALDAVFFYK